MTTRRSRMATCMLAAALTCTSTGTAQSDSTQPGTPATPPAGILPVPDYGGDFWSRSRLTGDWGGARTTLANKGVQFDVDWTQAFQSVVDGGRDTGSEYGGSLDYLLNLDLMRMGVLQGALLKVRAESRYGESVNGLSGQLLPVNTDAFFPLTSRIDDDIAITVTNLLYTQFLSEGFGVYMGKLDTLDGDPNEFASGRGVGQFMNANFVFNSAMALRLPYSTLGGGIVWLPVQQKDFGITVTSSIFNTVDSSTTTGFGDFDDGTSWTGEVDFQYRLGSLPGGQNIGFLYSFNQDFNKIGSRLVFEPGEGLVRPDEDDTWALYWSGWQYLWVMDDKDAPINPGDGMPDRRGIGLFARSGFADEDTNPVEWSLSGGIGGRGLIPGRDHDTLGLGYFYTDVQSTRLSGLVGIDDHTSGFEAFYNIAITPAAQLTLDAQVLESALPRADTAVVLGARLRLRF